MSIFGSVVGSLLGDVIDSDNQSRSDDRNFRNQRKLAQMQHGFQWEFVNNAMDKTLQRRVEDGRKAGLSPLASIGAAGAQMPNVPLSQASPSPRGNMSSTLANIGIAAHQAQVDKTNAETKNIELQSSIMRENHIARSNSNRGGQKAANVADDKPNATLAADTTIEDWEPGDVQLLSEEASQSFESVTSTLATLAINLGLYGNHAYNYLKDKFPEVKKDVIDKVIKQIDRFNSADKKPRKSRQQKYLPRSSAPYRSRFNSHHYR